MNRNDLIEWSLSWFSVISMVIHSKQKIFSSRQLVAQSQKWKHQSNVLKANAGKRGPE